MLHGRECKRTSIDCVCVYVCNMYCEWFWLMILSCISLMVQTYGLAFGICMNFSFSDAFCRRIHLLLLQVLLHFWGLRTKSNRNVVHHTESDTHTHTAHNVMQKMRFKFQNIASQLHIICTSRTISCRKYSFAHSFKLNTLNALNNLEPKWFELQFFFALSHCQSFFFPYQPNADFDLCDIHSRVRLLADCSKWFDSHVKMDNNYS